MLDSASSIVAPRPEVRSSLRGEGSEPPLRRTSGYPDEMVWIACDCADLSSAILISTIKPF